MTNSLFVTSLGDSDYKLVSYTFKGTKIKTTRFAPVATAKLLGLQGATALLLVTDEVKASENYNSFEAELRELGLKTIPIAISTEAHANNIASLLRSIDDHIPDNSRLTIDVTYSYRHLPFLYFAAVVFLCGLKKVQLKDIYYGQFERGKETAPLISIGHIFNLIEWFQSLRAFRDSGDAAAIARTLRSDVAQLFRQHVPDLDLSKVKDDADRLAEASGLGLPLEAGIAAAQLTQDMQRLTPATSAPLAYLALEVLGRTVAAWKVSASKEKCAIRLDKDELDRQVAFGRWLVDHGDLGSALRLVRELVVNISLFGSGEFSRWLDYAPTRLGAERYLNALAERAKAHLTLSAPEQQLAGVWASAAVLRNRVAHVGMCREDVHTSRDKIQALLSSCTGLLENPLTPAVSDGGTLLVSPLGKSPGVLFSALKTTNPDRVILVTSAEALEKLDEIKRHADYPYLECTVRKLSDPHAGFTENSASPDAEVDRLLVDAFEVIINITGGTTALQWMVERIAQRAARLGVNVKRIALVDRRSQAEQQANPYVVGERIDLEPSEGQVNFD